MINEVGDIQSPGYDTAKLVRIICCYYCGSFGISASEDSTHKKLK
jgi:hypothetical protein